MGKWPKLEDWIFWAHWGFVLREITRIWSQHLQTNLGNTCVGTILMQPLSLTISNNKDGITHCGKQGEGRQCSPLGRVLGLGSVWLSCRDSSSWCDVTLTVTEVVLQGTRTAGQSEVQKVPGTTDSSHQHTDQRGLVLVRLLALFPD